MLCSWGVVWFFPFLWMVYRNMKQMYGHFFMIMLLAFFLMQSNERYLEFPMSFIFVFQFKREGIYG